MPITLGGKARAASRWRRLWMAIACIFLLFLLNYIGFLAVTHDTAATRRPGARDKAGLTPGVRRSGEVPATEAPPKKKRKRRNNPHPDVTPAPPTNPDGSPATTTPPPSPPFLTATAHPDEHLSLEERFKRWSGGKPLTAKNVPLPDTGNIPDRLFGSWKTKMLGSRAQLYWDNFRAHEPQLEPIIVDDAECVTLASLYPGFGPRYNALPLAVMRADICRALAVYFFGGYYKDLDIDWRRPLKEWIDPSDGIVYGWEDDEHVCQWFFAARPGDPCLRNILQQIFLLVRDHSLMNFVENVEAVIDITGPGVWTDALQGCSYYPLYTIAEMKLDNIYHDYAAANWANTDGYVSWLEDRKNKTGWKDVWQDYNIHAFFLDDASNYMRPYREDLPAIRVRPALSTVNLNLDFIHGSHFATDMNIDTGFETGDESEPHLDIFFENPITVGTLYGDEDALPPSQYVACVRLYPKHRDAGYWHFIEAQGLELYDGTTLVHKTRKQGRITPYHQYFLAGTKRNVTQMRFSRLNSKGIFTGGEVQLFSDPLCKRARRLEPVGTRPRFSKHSAIHEVFRLITNVTHPCPNQRALSVKLGFQYGHCGPLRAKSEDRCATVVVGARTGPIIMDHMFLQKLHDVDCSPVSVAALPAIPSEPSDTGVMNGHRQVNWCEFNVGRCDLARVFFEALRPADDITADKPPTVMYLDMLTEEWREFPSMLSLLGDVKATSLFVPLRLTIDTIESPNLLRNLRWLLERYDVVGFNVNPGEGLLAGSDNVYPVETHISLRRKGT